jgi:hypothetical protein
MNTPVAPIENKKLPRPREGTDIDPALIVRVAIIFVLSIACVLTVLAILFRFWHGTHPDRTSEAAPRVTLADLPPLPRLQTAPAQDLRQVIAAENRHLMRYAWTDRAQGIAQIPIDRAMDLWLQTPAANGLTTTPPTTNAPSAATTELQMRQEKAKEAAHAP